MPRYLGICVDGRPAVYRADDRTCSLLDPRFDLRRHSPDGFNWGYGGSGPAQLALAILADFTKDDGVALKLYQRYKWAVVARLPHATWCIDGEEIEGWIIDLIGRNMMWPANGDGVEASHP